LRGEAWGRKVINHKRIAPTLTIMLLLASIFSLAYMPEAKSQSSASITPSKEWGVFFGTTGDVTITVNKAGIAVRVRMPRDFTFNRVENDTSFISSTITNDYFYYLLLDESSYSPYDPEAPFRIEVHNPDYTVPFNWPQYIFLKDLQAPTFAGIYIFTIYVATSLGPDGLPLFPDTPDEYLSVPVSMREDPSSISGYIIDPSLSYYAYRAGMPIKANGVVYATEVNIGARARAFVNPSTGFYNLTGLWGPGTYMLEASAGYFPDSGYAYTLTTYSRELTLTKGQRMYGVNITLDRGCIIDGTLTYTTPLGNIINSLDNPWLNSLGFTILNYAVEAYDPNGILVATYFGVSRNGPTDPFRLITRSEMKYVGYPSLGTQYSGFGPGEYTLKAWVFGYTQAAGVSAPPLYSPGMVVTANITMVVGALVSGTIIFPESPRESESLVLGSTSGTLYGGNVLAELFDLTGALKGVTVLDRTAPDGTVTYADSLTLRFYVLGFSEFYYKSYSGVWHEKDYGLDEGAYYVKVWVRGYFQERIEFVTLSKGASMTVSVSLLRGGAIRTTVASMTLNPSTGTLDAIPWRFFGYFLRLYYCNASTEVEIGYSEKQLNLGDPGVTSTTAEIAYTGTNWPTDKIILYGWLPTAIAEGDYKVKAYLYGYLHKRQSLVWVEAGKLGLAHVNLLKSASIKGKVSFKEDNYYASNLPESVFIRMEVPDAAAALRGAQILAVPAGSVWFAFEIYGYTGGTGHFFYVTPEGYRLKDYGLDAGSYTVRVLDFGYTRRYTQRVTVAVNLPSIDFVIEVLFDVHKLGKVFGVLMGQNYTGSPVRLSWGTVSSNSELVVSMDGAFTLHLPEGTYTITFMSPGYLEYSQQVIVYGSSLSDMGSIVLTQSGEPFYPVSIMVVIDQLGGGEAERAYVITAQVTVKGTNNLVVDYFWSCNGGTLNSTSGRTVEWAPPESASASRYTITVVASAYGYGRAKSCVTIRLTPIPEFNPNVLLMTATIAILSILLLRRLRNLTSLC